MEWHLESLRNIAKSQIKVANEQIDKCNKDIRETKFDNLRDMYKQSLNYWNGIKKANRIMVDEIDEKLQIIRESELFTKEAIEKTEKEGTCPF